MSYHRHQPQAARTGVWVRSPLAAHARRSLVLTPALFWSSLIAILALGTVLRAWNLAGADMWTDEILTAQRAQDPLRESLDSILQAGNQAPLYYMLLRFAPHHSDFMLRLPSVVLGVLSIALFTLAIDRLYHRRDLALQAGLLMALNPLHVLLSRTARFYALLIVLGLVAMISFLVIWRGSRSRGAWLTLWITSVASYLTHFSAAALPLSQGALLLATRRDDQRLWRNWLLVQTTAAIPPTLWIGLSQIVREPDTPLYTPPIPHLLDVPVSMLNLLIGYPGDWAWFEVPGLLVGIAGLTAGLSYIALDRERNPEQGYWALHATLPVTVLFLLAVTFFPKYHDRYLLLAMPGVILLFLTGWERLAPRFKYVALIITVLTSGYLTYTMFNTGAYERTDWSSAATFVEERFKLGDALLFDRSVTFDAFAHHAHADAEALAHVNFLDELPDTYTLEHAASRIWIVYRVQHEAYHEQGWRVDFDPFGPGVSPLSDWLLARRDRATIVQRYDGIVILWVSGLGP